MTIKSTIKKLQQRVAALTLDGAEICDPKPRSLPTGIKRPPTQEDRLRRILQAHRQEMQEDQEYVDETDFDIDEPDMLTAYEKSSYVFDTVPQVPASQDEDASSDEEGSGDTQTSEESSSSSDEQSE